MINMKIVLAIVITVMSASCEFNFRSVNASGNLMTEERKVEGFTAVDAAGPMDVDIKQSNSYKVTVEADDNLMRYIVVRKEGRKLLVKLEDNVHIRNSSGIKVHVEMPELQSVDLTGSGNVRTMGRIVSDNKMDIDLAGSGNISMEVKSPEVSASVAGSGKTDLAGETRKFDVSIAGSGDVNAKELKSEEAEISIGGSGNVKVFASMKLDVNIAGSGDIVYYGNPEISRSIIGSGGLRKGE